MVLVAPRPMAGSSRADILAAVGRPAGLTVAHLLLAAALILLLVAGMALWAGSRTPELPGGFAGVWNATNCATYFRDDGDRKITDCDRWGDGATIALEVGAGEPASIEVSTDGGVCSGTGTLETTPPMPAEGIFLWIEISDPACDLIVLGDDLASHLYLEPNDRRIWFDDDGDGWGLFWIRSD
jgi:hypothetical protein